MEWIVESIMDCLKMLPFLFAAFACMEAVEHYSGNKMNQMLEKAGHGGPLVGAVLGCIPQCGFSVMASDLYSGGMITLGTLLAVFLATSDEAVLLMLSSPGNGGEILKLMAVKVLIGIVAGYAVDLIFHRRKWGRESYGRNLRSLRMQGKPWNFKTGSEAYAPDFCVYFGFYAGHQLSD